MELNAHLTQLPIISYANLEAVGSKIQEKIKGLQLGEQLVTEQTTKALKVVRAELNKEAVQYETLRKEIKKQVLAPLEAFEAKYAQCITAPYKEADALLKEKITTYEERLKNEKALALHNYFEELKALHEINFVNFSQTGINITLSASEKKLKEELQAFVLNLKEGKALIESSPLTTQEQAEVMVLFKQSLNATQALTIFNERQKTKQKELEQITAKGNKAQNAPIQEAEPVQCLAPPQEQTSAAEPTAVLTATFTVRATKEKLIALKEFLNNQGIEIL